MSTQTDLEKRIEKERQRIASLRSEVERAEAFMQGLQEALAMLPKEKETRQGKSKVKSKVKGKLRSGSDIQKVYNLLLQKASPMHLSEILIGIGKEDTKANRMSFAGSLGRYVRNGKIFTRPGPNLFSLKQFVDTKAKLPLDLPKDFGT